MSNLKKTHDLAYTQHNFLLSDHFLAASCSETAALTPFFPSASHYPNFTCFRFVWMVLQPFEFCNHVYNILSPYTAKHKSHLS
jgi:hypothetical protein